LALAADAQRGLGTDFEPLVGDLGAALVARPVGTGLELVQRMLDLVEDDLQVALQRQAFLLLEGLGAFVARMVAVTLQVARLTQRAAMFSFGLHQPLQELFLQWLVVRLHQVQCPPEKLRWVGADASAVPAGSRRPIAYNPKYVARALASRCNPGPVALL